jgi:hypothetical protein
LNPDSPCKVEEAMSLRYKVLVKIIQLYSTGSQCGGPHVSPNTPRGGRSFNKSRPIMQTESKQVINLINENPIKLDEFTDPFQILIVLCSNSRPNPQQSATRCTSIKFHHGSITLSSQILVRSNYKP